MSVESGNPSERSDLQILCWEQERKIKSLKAEIKLLKKENKELNEKMAISSIAFDLPEDYYENDEYLV